SGAMLPPPGGLWGRPRDILQTLPGYGPDVAANRVEARKLMEKHGYGPDKRLAVKVATRNIPQFRDPAVIMIDQMKEIYIDGVLDVVETANWYPKVARRDYMVGTNLSGSGVDDPDAYFYEHYACGSERNYTNYCNPDLEKMYEQQSLETDQQKRKKLVWEIDRRRQEVAGLTGLRGEIEQKLKALAADALHGSQASFLTLANEAFARHKEGAEASLDQRQKAIEALLAPINASLEEYRKGVAEIEKSRLAAYSGLATEVQGLARLQADASAQTRKLVNALQAAPKTRGRWGEQQLHNVMELSGMTAYVDYLPEKTVDLDDARLRPDVIIRLPGDRRIVVDAKTSMAAYLDAVEETEEAAREAH